MNKLALFALIGAICVAAQLNPDSEQDILLPEEFSSTQWAAGLITQNFGIVFSEVHGEGSFGSNFYAFGVANEFEFSQAAPLYVADCVPQLINAGDNTDTFLVFCVEPQISSNPYWSMLQVNVSEDGELTVVRNATFAADSGYQFVEVAPSASAFVTLQGNVYLAVQQADQFGQDVIAIAEFNFNTFNVTVRVADLASTLNASSGHFLKDLHSLPFDEGVAVVLDTFDEQDNGTGQLFAFVFFNGTTVSVDLPAQQQLEYVGRHRGSSFGYTLADQLDSDLPYVDADSWDLSNLQNTNKVQSKGFTSRRFNNHFATEDAVYFYSDNQKRHGPERSAGILNELPYSEFGFLPNSANSMEISVAPFGDLLDGVDGTYIYSFTTQTDGQFYLSRWTY